MELTKVIENLVGMEVSEEIENNIICAFEDYEFEGVAEIIVSESSVGYQAYANHADAPIVMIKVEDEKITDAWVR